MQFIETMHGVVVNTAHIVTITNNRSTGIIEIIMIDERIISFHQEKTENTELLQCIMNAIGNNDYFFHEYDLVIYEARCEAGIVKEQPCDF